jgi:acetyltransferase-like isoleucine patch superfamily enzyme
MSIRLILNKIFYNPYKSMEKHRKTARCGEGTILQKSFKLDVRVDNEKNRIIIGNQNNLGCTLVLESNSGYIEIGNKCFINGGTNIISRSSIIIGDFVTIAWNVTIYDHDSHSLNYHERRADIEQQLVDYPSGNFIKNKNWDVVTSAPIVISDDVWIGMNATILKGVTIGEGAIVAAGAVVTKNVEPWTVVAGNPAKCVKRINKQEAKHRL